MGSSAIFSVVYEVCSSAHSEERETRPPAQWASRAIRQYCANGNGVYGTALRNGSTDTVLRLRMNGNVRRETTAEQKRFQPFL